MKLFDEKEGLTWRTLLAILLSSAIFLPIQIYMSLATPVSVSWPSVILLLFTELAYFFHTPLSKQEGFIIYFVSSVAIGASVLVENMIPFLNFPYRVYMIKSPYLKALGFDKHIPWWFSPPPNSPILKIRSLLHPGWSLYIGLMILNFIIYLGMIISMAFILAQLYIEIEKLPFPIGKVQAETIISLTEREPERFNRFVISAVIGFLYSLLLYGIPIFSQAFFGRSFSVTGSIIWSFLDFTQLLQEFLPGVILGISLDLLNLASAWIIPWYVIVSAAITSITTFVIGNYLALKLPLPYFEPWRRDYYPDASLMWLYQRSIYDIWMNLNIGIALAAGIIPMIIQYKNYARAFSNLRTLPERFKRAGYLSLNKLLAIYFASIFTSLFLFIYLIPKFPYYLLIPFIVWGFIWPFVSTWSIGVTGFAPSQPPLMRQATIFLSGYKGLDIWFGGWIAQPGNAPGVIVNAFQVGYWCGVKPKTYLKAAFIAIPLLFIFSFIYVNMFWSMAPMPSAYYPWIEITWPISVINWAVWPTLAIKGYFPTIHLDLIIMFFIIATIIAVILGILKLPLSILIGILWGATTMPHSLLGSVIGILVGKVFERIMGKERWDKEKVVLIAGLTLGNATSIAIAASILIISKSLWALPY